MYQNLPKDQIETQTLCAKYANRKSKSSEKNMIPLAGMHIGLSKLDITTSTVLGKQGSCHQNLRKARRGIKHPLPLLCFLMPALMLTVQRVH